MKQELLERTRNEVAAGVAILDQIEPNWYNRIDLDAFKMSNPNFCVMGQVFGPNDVDVENSEIFERNGEFVVRVKVGDFEDESEQF